MGTRLHYATTYKIEWDGGWFNWNAPQFREILRRLGVQVWECVNDGNDYDDIELSKDEWEHLREILNSVPESDMEKPILSLTDLKKIGETEDVSRITYENLIEWFLEVDERYDKENSYIRFSWF